MAGIVNEQGRLRVDDAGGGGGSNVTVVGPLGSQPAASSVSVAIASDQLPLPVSFTESDDTTGPLAWSFGVGGPTTITTSGPGTVIALVSKVTALSGNIKVEEQFTPAGAFFSATGFLVPAAALGNPLQSYQAFTGTFGFNAGSTDFIAIINTHGIAIKFTNQLLGGSLNISFVFKRNEFSTRPVAIQGQINGFAADVSNDNQLRTTLLGASDIQWQFNTPVTDAISNPGGRSTVIVLDVPLLFNGATFDMMRGDLTNGVFVNIKNSVPLTVAGASTPTDFEANPTNAVPAESYLMGWDSGFSAWLRLRCNDSGILKVDTGVTTSTAIADTTGTPALLSTVGTFASVLLNGQASAGVVIQAGFTGTIAAEVSYDSASSWVRTLFIDSATGVLSSSLTLTGNALSSTILLPGGASNARVVVTSFVTPFGTSSATVRATTQEPLITNANASDSNPILTEGPARLSVDLGGNLRTLSNVIMNLTDPTYSIDGATVPQSVNQNGRLRVTAVIEDDINFFNQSSFFPDLEVFEQNSPWS